MSQGRAASRWPKPGCDEPVAHVVRSVVPGGYDSVIGERGATLSGGQRQRLSIARALCRETPVIILDEPTAALDAESEASLLDLLRHGADGRTVMMVAHRLSTLRRADRVVVLEGGRVSEVGTPDELLRNGGLFARYAALADRWPDVGELVIDLSDATPQTKLSDRISAMMGTIDLTGR